MIAACAIILCGTVTAGGLPINGSPDLYGNGSLPCTIGGVFFSDATRAMYSSPRVDLRNFVVLGKVEGRAVMKNILFLVNFGDTGFQAMKKFVFFMETEAIIRGVAVKYRTPVHAAK